VVPDPEKSLEQGAVLPWRREANAWWSITRPCSGGSAHWQQSLDTPYKDLPEAFKQILLRAPVRWSGVHLLARGQDEQDHAAVRRMIPNLERLYQESESEFTRNGSSLHEPAVLRRLRRPAAQARNSRVTLGEVAAGFKLRRDGSGKDARRPALPEGPGSRALDHAGMRIVGRSSDDFFATLKLTAFQEKIARDLVKEIRARWVSSRTSDLAT